jgi:pSer/pThr/pTyr-binding forkhead associated (FHA) protein
VSSSVARFEVVAGKAVGMSILVEDELLIGRHAEGAGRLADDDEISRMHARVALDQSGFCAIEDLGSTNGTFVNGLRLTGPQTLSEGDIVELGATTLTVSELRPAAPDPSAGSSASQPTIVPPGQAVQPVDEVAPADLVSDAPNGLASDVEPAPMLSVRVEVDFEAREARLVLNEGSEPVRLVLDGGVWRAVTSAD